MKTVHGIKLGGLQHKIFNLMLIMILALIGAYLAVAVYQQRNLSGIVRGASVSQQESITEVSEQTMQAVLNSTMAKSTALQAYIADDLFNDVRTDVMTLQAFADQLFENADRFSAHPFSEPDPEKDGAHAGNLSRRYRLLSV